MNMEIGHVDTLFLPSRQEHAHISSTIVRELIANKADVSAFVPKAVRIP
jgi:phosphopantetheine adenylyltransferase